MITALTLLAELPELGDLSEKRTGKPAKVALTACMRKLLTILNAIMKTSRGWEPRPIDYTRG